MYIEKRKLKNDIKYYLSYSFREGKKVHKVRKYLGRNLNETSLKERKITAEKLILDEINRYNIIKDPLEKPLSKKEIEFVRDIEKNQKLKIFHLSDKQWKIFSEIFIYNTNAIEGSELNIKEVKEIIEEDKWPPKPKEDIAEAYGLDDAINYVKDTKDNLSLELIKRLHKHVFRNSKSFAGKFRKKGEEVVIRDGFGDIVHRGAPQSRVVSLLHELIEWHNKSRKAYPALILAAVVHNQFENIHPFADGNGRVGRLLLNFVLLKNGMPPVNIDLKNRIQYYQTLQEYEKHHNLRPTLDLIIKEYKALKKKFG